MSNTTPATVTVETLPVLAHQGQRVVTTDLLAQLYGTGAKNIHDNFANNEIRFEPGKHYVKLVGDELRRFKHQPEIIGLVARNASHLFLWTERGAARHAKMLDTDQAWEVFERLEDAYFRVPEPAKPKAVESGWPKLLPEPPDPLTREVRAAINRKAHALSLSAFEANRETLEDWVRGLPQGRDALTALEQIHSLDLDHGQHVLVNFQALWRVTTWAGELRRLAQAMQIEVEALEQATGRRLFVR